MALKIIRAGKTLPPVEEPKAHVNVEKVKQTVFLDDYCSVVIKDYPNALVAWYLIASYLYYVHDLSALTDGLFDSLARQLKEKWATIEHPHKNLITEADLSSGTLYALRPEQYPGMTKGAASALAKSAWGVILNTRH